MVPRQCCFQAVPLTSSLTPPNFESYDIIPLVSQQLWIQASCCSFQYHPCWNSWGLGYGPSDRCLSTPWLICFGLILYPVQPLNLEVIPHGLSSPVICDPLWSRFALSRRLTTASRLSLSLWPHISSHPSVLEGRWGLNTVLHLPLFLSSYSAEIPWSVIITPCVHF